MGWRNGLVGAVFALSVAGPAAAQQQEVENNLKFPIQTRIGATTIADCSKLEEDGSIGLKFLQALDKGFHKDNPYYQPGFSKYAVKTHLRFEGIQENHYKFIKAECGRRLET